MFDVKSPNALSTKSMERLRRKKISMVPDLNEIHDHTVIPYAQEKFLSNENNKNKLIQTLMEAFETEVFFFSKLLKMLTF